MRIDVYLTEKKLVKSRTAAQSLINIGGVYVNGRMAQKSSMDVTEADVVTIEEIKLPKYVGRGGLKLEGALNHFRLNISGAVCVDIGASTGGFTDCMLQSGAEKVFAVDVGRGQLNEKLRKDPRVISLEQTDIRDFDFDEYPAGADFIGADVSFISLKLVLPEIWRLLKTGCCAVTLIKPQFEAGRAALNKRGIVTDKRTREFVVNELLCFAEQCGFTVAGVTESPITGGDGNTEYLMYNIKDR